MMLESTPSWTYMRLCLILLFLCTGHIACVRLRHHRPHKIETARPVRVNDQGPFSTLSTQPTSTAAPTSATGVDGQRPSSAMDVPDEVENDLKASTYSPWSVWSPCTRKCKQERSRQCNAPWQCDNIVVKEERSCTGRRCRKPPFKVVDETQTSSTVTSERLEQLMAATQRNLTVDPMKTIIYSAWSEWSPCTRNCRTRRYRSCEMRYFCGSSAIQEDAFCYVKGTMCERTFKRLRKDKDLSNGKESKEQQLPKTSYARNPTADECGISNVSTEVELKIIGGQPVTKGKWPWQAAILNRFKEAFCGGTLIAPQWVLTAAHCLRKRLFVRLGEHDLRIPEGTEQEYRVVNHFGHPDYDPETVDNDVALLKLSSPVHWTKHVQLSCLPKASSPLPQDRPCVILGWGKETHMSVQGTEILHQARVPIVDMKYCLEVYEDYYITKNMFCAGHPRGRVDSCAGDSGGPLLCESHNRWYVYGITSFGEGCARKGKYGIYAKVPNYIKWIEKTMEDNSDVL